MKLIALNKLIIIYILLPYFMNNKDNAIFDSILKLTKNKDLMSKIMNINNFKQILNGFFNKDISKICLSNLDNFDIDFSVITGDNISLSIMDIMAQIDNKLKEGNNDKLNIGNVINELQECSKRINFNEKISFFGFFAKIFYDYDFILTIIKSQLTIFISTVMVSVFMGNYKQIGKNIRSIISKISKVKTKNDNKNDINYIFESLNYNDILFCKDILSETDNKNDQDVISKIQLIVKKCIDKIYFSKYNNN